jgi:hypothetical protein
VQQQVLVEARVSALAQVLLVQARRARQSLAARVATPAVPVVMRVWRARLAFPEPALALALALADSPHWVPIRSPRHQPSLRSQRRTATSCSGRGVMAAVR